jgi:aminoglycoside phosphotransferase (APT) family kinase protein
MHAGEADTSPALVRRLLGQQFPRWAGLPLTPVDSAGTDNAIYRLGPDLAVRLPRIGWAVGQVEKEHTWLPRLRPRLPLAIPEPVARGEPGQGYPWPWSVYRWLPGVNAIHARLTDLRRAAADVAGFVAALQRLDTAGGLPASEHNVRGLPLRARDAATRQAIAALDGLVDAEAARRVWEAALEAPDWDRAPVWFHGDLLPGNLLVEQGRVRAVIDFSGLAVGDPACDLMIAWSLFAGESRQAFREALGVDEAAWARGRGHALSQALIFVPYYLRTNPVGARAARRTINEVLAAGG